MDPAEIQPDNSQFAASIVPVCSTPKKYREEEATPQQSYSLEALWRRHPLQYNPLLDSSNRSYLTAPRVVKHLIKQGFIANVSVPHPKKQKDKKNQTKIMEYHKFILSRMEQLFLQEMKNTR